MSSTSLVKSSNTKSMTTLPPRKETHSFTGKLQPCASRIPQIPDVDYSRGGSDFRCPHNTSSFGRQVLGKGGYETSPCMVFTASNRFGKSETLGVGPGALGQTSSMRKQLLSHKKSAESTSFGTSNRDSALKLYAIYTCKK